MRRATAVFVLSMVIASGCKTEEERCVDSGGKLLNASQLRKVYRGNTMSGTIPSINIKFHIYYHPDGRMAGKAISGVGVDSDKGIYKIKESGEICTRWNKWQGSGCASVYRHGKEYKIFNPKGGALFARQNMRKGNPEQLPF